MVKEIRKMIVRLDVVDEDELRACSRRNKAKRQKAKGKKFDGRKVGVYRRRTIFIAKVILCNGMTDRGIFAD